MKPNRYEYRTICRQCGHRNQMTATTCEMCNHPFSSEKVPIDRSSAFQWSLIPLIGLVLISLVGFFVWRNRLFSTTTANNPISTLPARSDKKTYSQLTMLGNSFSGYSTFRTIELQQALKSAGIDLRYQLEADEMHLSQQVQLLNQGKADIVLSALDEFLLQKVDGKIVGLIDRTMGGDAVILNTKKYSQLRSLQDLTQLVEQQRSQGKLLGIAFTSDSPSEYLALLLSAKFEAFKLSDFQVHKVEDAADAWKMMQDPKKNVAVAVVWEPYVTQARKQGYTVVLSSEDTPGAIVDVITASNRAIEEQPENVSQLLSAYYRRVDANVRDASALKQQIAIDGKLSSGDAIAIMQGIKFFTAPEVEAWMTDGTLEKRIGSTAAVLALAGKLNSVPQPKDLFDSRFIAKAANNTQTLIELVRADNPELADRLAGKAKAIAPSRSVKTNVQTAPHIGNLQVRGNVKFAYDSATLTAEGKQTLDRLAREIGEFNDQTVAVRVIGHTSKTGVPQLNQKLSQQRAQVVANYLKTHGLKHKIVAEGKGFSQALPGISAGDTRNQRTEIRLVRLNS